jgi:hypothetical protein
MQGLDKEMQEKSKAFFERLYGYQDQFNEEV